MNFQFYLEKLFASPNFQGFLKENPDAYPCSGFFVIDKENLTPLGVYPKGHKPKDTEFKGKENKQHFDYYVPSINKMFSFQLESGCEKVPIDILNNKIPEKISMNYNFDFNKVEKLIESKMFEEKINNKLQKILLSLQKVDNKDYLVGTVFISGLGMLNVRINVSEMKVVLFEKKSFFDMLSIKKKEED